MDCPENSGIIKSPAGGEISKKVTDVFTVRFEPASDREFIRWRVLDIATGNEVTDDEYLVLSALTDSETECTFKKAPEGEIRLSLEPVIVERPQILSYTPLFETNGVNKDSAIQVIFDYDLNEDSIYFTDDEVYKWENTNGVTLLPPENVNGRERYYGYKKDGKTFFKNISITNNETGENLNDYFSAPMFENPHRLSISVKKNSAGNALLPPWTQVLVSLERGFFYKVDDKPVCMTAGKKWIYQVTNSEDKTSPGVVSNEVKLVTSTGTTTLTALSAVPSSPWASSSIPYANIKKLSINCKVKDTGSGPANSFLVNFKKVGTYGGGRGFIPETKDSVIPKDINYQSVMGENAECNKTLDFSDQNLEDGVYAVWLEFKDKSGNSTVYPSNGNKFYFNIDTTAPHIGNYFDITDGSLLTDVDGTFLAIYWYSNDEASYPSAWVSADLKATVKYKKTTASSYTTTIVVPTIDSYNSCLQTSRLTGLEPGTTYNLVISFADYNGHTLPSKSFTVSTNFGNPKPPTNLRKTVNTSGSTPTITIAWDAPSGNFDDYYFICKWTKTNGKGGSDERSIPKGTNSHTVTLTGGVLSKSNIVVSICTRKFPPDGGIDIPSDYATLSFPIN